MLIYGHFFNLMHKRRAQCDHVKCCRRSRLSCIYVWKSHDNELHVAASSAVFIDLKLKSYCLFIVIAITVLKNHSLWRWDGIGVFSAVPLIEYPTTLLNVCIGCDFVRQIHIRFARLGVDECNISRLHLSQSQVNRRNA